MISYRVLLAALLLSIVCDAKAEAAPDFAKVRKAVVIVIARGVLINLGNAPAVSQGTGFFVSKDGFLVTSYHVRTDLGEVDDQSVEYEILFGTDVAQTVRASPVFINPAADVMVLYAPVGDRDIDILVPGSRTGVIAGSTTIYTAGYPAGYQFSVDRGVIRSFGGLIEPIPAWTTSMTFKSGQSGSPIVLDDLRVVAIAKGNDAAERSIGLIVPSRLVPPNFWDGTLNASRSVMEVLAKGEFRTLPRVLVQASVNSVSPVQKTTVFTLQNRLCDDTSSKVYQVSATAGWTIDPASITVDMLSFTGASARYAVTERSKDGFTVTAELANIGKCLRVLNRTIEGGVAAQFTGKVTYYEAPPMPSRRLVTVASAALIGNVQSPLPDIPRDQLKFSVMTPSGSLIEFEPTAEELEKKNGVLVLDNKKVEKRVLK